MLPKNWHTYKRLYYHARRYKMPKYSMYKRTIHPVPKMPTWYVVALAILFIIGLMILWKIYFNRRIRSK